ncbi:hypothetical protein [Aquimarina aquimarini]|uniref:hypothetical protein n=1 Tax=Aquimarina aquimarini TaxID=1191734 RepID=UPI000D560506|nr:hypothetical protein [Aquimarina aquimarini]
MQKTLTLIFYLIFCQVFGQSDSKISLGDFNNDKAVDTLKSFYEGGSSFGGKHVQIINGKTNEMHELTNDGCFCEIKKTILIPSELNKTENQLFLETIKEQLLPEKKNVPDPSLDWIIRSSFSNNKLDNNSFFDLIIDPQTNWVNNKFEYPYNYYIDIKGDTLNQLHNTPKRFTKKDNKGFLVYYAHNHYRNKAGDSLQVSDSNSLYKTFHTSHGVVVKKEDFYKWVFISDFSLTGAPEKLRWESIKSVKLFDDYLIVRQDLPPTGTYRLYVINIETGICGRVKYDFSSSNNTIDDDKKTSLIQGKSIILNIEEKQLKYKLKNIFKELDAQHLTKK